MNFGPNPTPPVTYVQFFTQLECTSTNPSAVILTRQWVFNDVLASDKVTLLLDQPTGVIPITFTITDFGNTELTSDTDLFVV